MPKDGHTTVNGVETGSSLVDVDTGSAIVAVGADDGELKRFDDL